MTHSNKVAHDEAGYIFFDASKEIISIFFLEEQKGNKKLRTETQCFHFLLKAADSSRTCVRITTIICYYCALLLLELFPNGGRAHF